METNARPGRCAETRSAAVPSAQAEAFLARLSEVQTNYLRTVSEAIHLLDTHRGLAANSVAIHLRLTQQFFDGQRLIIRRRAETDAGVARIADDTAARILDITNDAHEGVLPADEHPIAAIDETVPVAIAASAGSTDHARSIRQQIAELGSTVLRSCADIDSLATVIDDAFGWEQLDGTAARRQLQAVLDDWWTAENAEAAAALDDANARAAMQLHVARIRAEDIAGHAATATREAVDEAATEDDETVDDAVDDETVDDAVEEGEIVEGETVEDSAVEDGIVDGSVVEDDIDEHEPSASDDDGDAAASEPGVPAEAHVALKSADIAAVLDGIGHADLDATLATLLGSLESPRESPMTATSDAEVADGVTESVPSLRPIEEVVSPGDLFDGAAEGTVQSAGRALDDFWSTVDARPAAPRDRPWVATTMMLPAVAMVSVVALVLAVIG